MTETRPPGDDPAERPLAAWTKAAAVAYAVVIVALLVVFRSRLHADLWPPDSSRIAPNIVATVVQVIVATPVAVLLWPPTRRRIHRFMARHIPPLHDTLTRMQEERQRHHEEMMSAHIETQRHLQHIITHSSEIPPLPPRPRPGRYSRSAFAPTDQGLLNTEGEHMIRQWESLAAHPIPDEILRKVKVVNAAAPSLIEWGNFAHGDLSEFADTTGANHGSTQGTAVVMKDSDGSYFCRMTTNDQSRLYGDNNNVRLHLIGIKGGLPAWFNNGPVGICMSFRLPKVTNPSRYEFVSLEVHGDNGSGPAPTNTCHQRAASKRLAIRGSTFSTPNPPGGFPFEQNTFGSPHTQQYDGQYYRHNADWASGDYLDKGDEEWFDLLCWWPGGYTIDPAKGAFQAWARYGGAADLHEIVPLKTGIRTGYVDLNHDGAAVYPMLSVYYPVGGGGTQVADAKAGAICNDLATLQAWQKKRLSIGGDGPTPPPVVDIPAAEDHLKQTTLSGAEMVRRYGNDISKWPTGFWQSAWKDLGLLP